MSISSRFILFKRLVEKRLKNMYSIVFLKQYSRGKIMFLKFRIFSFVTRETAVICIRIL